MKRNKENKKYTLSCKEPEMEGGKFVFTKVAITNRLPMSLYMCASP